MRPYNATRGPFGAHQNVAKRGNSVRATPSLHPHARKAGGKQNPGAGGALLTLRHKRLHYPQPVEERIVSELGGMHTVARSEVQDSRLMH